MKWMGIDEHKQTSKYADLSQELAEGDGEREPSIDLSCATPLFLCCKQFIFITLTSVPPGRHSGMSIVI